MREDAELVTAARSSEPEAFGELVERWFDRCWEVAWRIVHDRELAADVAQDTLLRAWQQLDRLEQPASFGGWVLRIARNRALDRLEKERRAVPTAEDATLEPRREEAAVLADPAGEYERVQRGDLVWAAAAALGERDASILDLHLRHGLEPHELASELDIAPNAAHQALFRLRSRLGDAIRAWLLWHHGEPACVALRAELTAAGVETFDAATARAVGRHADTCVTCADERERVTAPAALFSVVPLLVAPAALRTQAVRALGDAGVPVTSSPGGGGAPPGADGPGAGSSPDPSAVRRALAVRVTVAACLALLFGLGAYLLWGGPADPLLATPVLDPDADAVAEPDLPLGDDGEVDGAADVDPSGAPGETDVPSSQAPGGTVDGGDESPAVDDDGSDTDTDGTDEADGDAADEEEPSTGDEDGQPPTIEDGFVVRATTEPCDRSGGLVHLVWWETTGAQTVHLATDAGHDEEVDPVGSGHEVCAPRGSAFTLTATNEHGTTTQTTTGTG